MPTVEDGLRWLLAHREQFQDCILCKRKACGFGVFVPDDSQLYGAPAGKSRLIGYGLCKRCWKLADRNARIESHILNELYPSVGSTGAWRATRARARRPRP